MIHPGHPDNCSCGVCITPDEVLWEEYAKRRNFHLLSSVDFKFARGVFLDGMSWAREQ